MVGSCTVDRIVHNARQSLPKVRIERMVTRDKHGRCLGLMIGVHRGSGKVTFGPVVVRVDHPGLLNPTGPRGLGAALAAVQAPRVVLGRRASRDPEESVSVLVVMDAEKRLAARRLRLPAREVLRLLQELLHLSRLVQKRDRQRCQYRLLARPSLLSC